MASEPNPEGVFRVAEKIVTENPVNDENDLSRVEPGATTPSTGSTANISQGLSETALAPGITIGDKYAPAMTITDQAEADAYFERCVAHTMFFGRTRETAESIERQNLGYYAGYYDDETRARVEQLFRCAHPVFGAIAHRGAPTLDEALEAGKRLARSGGGE